MARPICESTAFKSLDQTFSSTLDRGCFHTVRPIFRDRYLANVSSMARSGTRLLLFMKAFLNEGTDSKERRGDTETG